MSRFGDGTLDEGYNRKCISCQQPTPTGPICERCQRGGRRPRSKSFNAAAPALDLAAFNAERAQARGPPPPIASRPAHALMPLSAMPAHRVQVPLAGMMPLYHQPSSPAIAVTAQQGGAWLRQSSGDAHDSFRYEPVMAASDPLDASMVHSGIHNSAIHNSGIHQPHFDPVSGQAYYDDGYGANINNNNNQAYPNNNNNDYNVDNSANNNNNNGGFVPAAPFGQQSAHTPRRRSASLSETEMQTDGILESARSAAADPYQDKFIILAPAPADEVATVQTGQDKVHRCCEVCMQPKMCSKTQNEKGRTQMMCLSCRLTTLKKIRELGLTRTNSAKTSGGGFSLKNLFSKEKKKVSTSQPELSELDTGKATPPAPLVSTHSTSAPDGLSNSGMGFAPVTPPLTAFTSSSPPTIPQQQQLDLYEEVNPWMAGGGGGGGGEVNPWMSPQPPMTGGGGGMSPKMGGGGEVNPWMSPQPPMMGGGGGVGGAPPIMGGAQVGGTVKPARPHRMASDAPPAAMSYRPSQNNLGAGWDDGSGGGGGGYPVDPMARAASPPPVRPFGSRVPPGVVATPFAASRSPPPVSRYPQPGAAPARADARSRAATAIDPSRAPPFGGFAATPFASPASPFVVAAAPAPAPSAAPQDNYGNLQLIQDPNAARGDVYGQLQINPQRF